MGVCQVKGLVARNILVWDGISLSSAPPALSNASKPPGPGQACPRALAWAGAHQACVLAAPTATFNAKIAVHVLNKVIEKIWK